MSNTMGTLPDGVSRLVVVRDGDEFVLGRADLGLYVEVPEPGAVFIEALQKGASLAEATALAGDAAGEPVDGADFLDTLAEAGLFAVPSTAPSKLEVSGGRGRRDIRWIEGVSPATARHLFGVAAWTGYAAAAAIAAALLILRPDLRPSYDDVWFLGDPVRSILAYAPLAIGFAAAHEAWHWLAARAIGVPATFRVSYRALFLVFETDISQVTGVPRRRRYGPFLAGMALDCVVLATALLLRLGYREAFIDLPPVLNRLLGLVVLGQVLTLGWQFAAVFLRSDVYAILANALRCNNLYRVTYLVAKERVKRLSGGETQELAAANPRDRAVAGWFSTVYLAGMIIMIWFTLNVTLPALVTIGGWLWWSLAAGSMSSAAFWESVAVAGYRAAVFGLPALLARRERRLRREGTLT